MAWNPSQTVIGTLWSSVFLLRTLAALIVWKKAPRNRLFWCIIGVFLANWLLNVTWSYFFFTHQTPAFWEAGLLDVSVLALIFLVWPISRLASGLLVPGAAWVLIATYLTYLSWMLK